MSDNSVFTIRDRRNGFFWVNNEIVDDYAPRLGGTALLVYMVLCRYADNSTAECHPSQSRLAKVCEVEERTIRRAIVKLVEVGLVSKEKERSGGGEFSKTVYTLLNVQRSLMSSGPPDIPPPDITTGHQAPTNKTHLEQDLKEEQDSALNQVGNIVKLTSEPTTTPTSNSDRNDALEQRRERLRMADQRQAEKQAGKGRGLRSPTYDRKQQATPRETFAEIRERKNHDAVSNPQLRECLRDALLEAAAVLGKELDALQVRVWVTDMRLYPDELIAEAFTAYRRKSGKYFPKPAEIIEIIEQLNKPVKETALERQQRENRERQARNAEEAARA